MRRLLACLCFFGLFGLAWSHEVKLETGRQEAQVLRLVYADGQAFAFEAYELYLPGQSVPAQVGRTNADGQVVFLAGAHSEWRLKAYSADGHGVDQVIQTVPGVPGGGTQARQALPRGLLLAAGLAMIFGLFGVFQLFLRKKN